MENQNQNREWEQPIIALTEQINQVVKDLINVASNTVPGPGQPPAPAVPPVKTKEQIELERTAKLIEAGTRELNPDFKSTIEIIEKPVYSAQEKSQFGTAIASQIKEGTEQIKADRRDRAIQKLLGENIDTPFLNVASPM